MKSFIKKGICLGGIVLFMAGNFMGSVNAENRSITINSKGRFLYTDAETGKTVLLDAEDFSRLANQLIKVEEEVSSQKTTVNNYNKQITQITNDLTEIENILNRLDSEVNVRVERWDNATQSLYLMPVQ